VAVEALLTVVVPVLLVDLMGAVGAAAPMLLAVLVRLVLLCLNGSGEKHGKRIYCTRIFNN
jgi:hypothetical protein